MFLVFRAIRVEFPIIECAQLTMAHLKQKTRMSIVKTRSHATRAGGGLRYLSKHSPCGV